MRLYHVSEAVDIATLGTLLCPLHVSPHLLFTAMTKVPNMQMEKQRCPKVLQVLDHKPRLEAWSKKLSHASTAVFVTEQESLPLVYQRSSVWREGRHG